MWDKFFACNNYTSLQQDVKVHHLVRIYNIICLN